MAILKSTDVEPPAATPGFADAFSDAADRYVVSRPAYPAMHFNRLAALAARQALAWDCGTGNGQAAIGLAEHFDRVEATDASAKQIANALLDPRVRYRVALAEVSGLEDRSVDLISVAQALHWFDLPRFYAEVRRVARPGGILAAYGYDWFHISPEIDALTEKFLLQPVAAYWSPNNRILWEGYRTIEFPFEELPAKADNIDVTWTLDQLFGFFLTWSAPRRKRQAEGDEFLELARVEFESAWGDPGRPRQIVMPMHLRVGRVS